MRTAWAGSRRRMWAMTILECLLLVLDACYWHDKSKQIHKLSRDSHDYRNEICVRLRCQYIFLAKKMHVSVNCDKSHFALLLKFYCD